MFPALHLSATGLCDRNTSRLAVESDRSFSQTALQSSPPSHPSREMRATMTSVSFGAIGANPMHPFPGIPFCAPNLGGSNGLNLTSPLFQYPASLYASQAADLKQISLTQYQAMNQATIAAEISKMKSPFVNRNYLELAMLVCNTFRGKLFPCSHCRYVTDRRNNLKRHISTMHQACDKVLECCGVKFSTKASLREHIMIFHHNGYSCPFCGRRFCRKALLKRHLSVHSGQKDYTCPHCDYATSHKSNLERHKRIHERIRLGEDLDIPEGSYEGLRKSPITVDTMPDTTMTSGNDDKDDFIDMDENDSDDDIDDDAFIAKHHPTALAPPKNTPKEHARVETITSSTVISEDDSSEVQSSEK
ncbi:hypothetical protein SNE40_001370 [Patella caerulea]|uniref:C2H2-type domain-containing protein n=1 Tax=Patella caerulea TaxID=87958 RepID=A0AAN8QB31_PATCE